MSAHVWMCAPECACVWGKARKMEGPQGLLARQSSCVSELQPQREILSQQSMVVSSEGGTWPLHASASLCTLAST